MSYVMLSLAIISEIIATALLKLSDGFTKIIPTLAALAGYFCCHLFFAKAIAEINLGVAYAIWCGAGIILTALVAYILFNEHFKPVEMIGFVLIIAGCIMVNMCKE